MTTLPYTITQADIEFHSVLMREHAGFLHLSLEVEPFKDEAYQQHQEWEQFITAHHPREQLAPLLQQLKELKQTLMTRLAAGEWLGWMSWSTVRHYLEELLQFELLLSGRRPTPAIEAIQTYRLLADHLIDAESKTDPSEDDYKADERALIANIPHAIEALKHRDVTDALAEYEATITALAQEKGQPANDVQWMIGLTLRAGTRIDKLFGEIKEAKPKSIISPRLLAHWLAEGHHMLTNLQLSETGSEKLIPE